MISNVAADKARKRIHVNKSLVPFVIARNGACIKYPELQQCSPTLYRDGTHLTNAGQVIFLNTIHDALIAITLNHAKMYP
jgi:hypothetical protein